MQHNRRGKYLLRNTVIFSIGNFGTKMISFFLVPIYTNILSTSEFGTVDLIYTIGTVLVPLLTLNIGESVMRFSLDKDADKEKIMSIGLGLLILSTFVGIIVFPLSKLMAETSSYSVYIYIYTITLAYSQVFLCYLRGKEELLKYSIGNIIHSLAIAILNIIFLLGLRYGIKGYLMAYIISNCITALYTFITGNVLSVIRNFKKDIELSKKMLLYSVVLIPNSFLWWIMNSSDRLMLTAMIGATANGIFAIAYKIPTLLSTITTIFTQAWSYSAIREEESLDKEEYSNLVYNNLVSMTVIVAAGLMMVMKPFLGYYVQDSYYIAWRYTPYLIIGFVFMTLGTFISTTYIVKKDSKGMLKSAVYGAGVNLILSWILISLIGIAGAALATGMGYIAVYIYRVIDTRKYLRLNVLNRKHLLGYSLLIVIAFSMFIDSLFGQIILVLEFCVITYVFRACIKELLRIVNNKLRKNKS